MQAKPLEQCLALVSAQGRLAFTALQLQLDLHIAPAIQSHSGTPWDGPRKSLDSRLGSPLL